MTDQILHRIEEIENKLTQYRVNNKMIMITNLFLLRLVLEYMEAQLGYAQTLSIEKVEVWRNGGLITQNRLKWIDNTKSEINNCKNCIIEIEKMLYPNDWIK